MKKWYLICTKPGQETLALDSLQSCGFQCFYPTLTSPQQTTEPLFPRYLFAQLDDPLMGQTWSTVRTAPGLLKKSKAWADYGEAGKPLRPAIAKLART